MPAKKSSPSEMATSLVDLRQRFAEDPWGVFTQCEQLLRQAADLALEALDDVETKLIDSRSDGDEETAGAVLQLLGTADAGGDYDESFEQAMIALEMRQARYSPISSQAGKPYIKKPFGTNKTEAAKKTAKKKSAKKAAKKKDASPDELEKGSRVRIVKGKEGVGIEGEIFWWGDSKFGDNMRAGVRGDDGETYWVDDSALELA